MKKRILAVSMVLAILMTMVSLTVSALVPNHEDFDSEAVTINGSNGTGNMTFSATGGTMALTNLAAEIPIAGDGNALKFTSNANAYYPGLYFNLTGLTANKSYTVTFDYKELTGSYTNYCDYNGASLGSFAPAAGSVISYSKTFIYGTATSLEVFLGSGTANGSFAIDNFNVTGIILRDQYLIL